MNVKTDVSPETMVFGLKAFKKQMRQPFELKLRIYY